MRPANLKTLKDKSTLGRRAGRPFIFKLIWSGVSLVALFALIIYLLFFSGLLEIQNIALSDSEETIRNQIASEINSVLNLTQLKFLKTQKNILFFDSSELERQLLANLSFIGDIRITKRFPHGLDINFSEKIPAGTWCFNGERCSYFDSGGSLWGNAVKSSGFLLLVVNDQRNNENGRISLSGDVFLNPIMRISEYFKNLDLRIKDAVIPPDSLGEFRINTDKGYPVIFDVEGDIAGQLENLRILLNERGKDPNFKPQYINLKIDGRVYLR